MFSNYKLQTSCSELQFDKFEDSINPNGNLQKKVSCNDVICKSSKQRDLQTTTNPKKKVNEEFALFTSSF